MNRSNSLFTTTAEKSDGGTLLHHEIDADLAQDRLERP